MIELNEHNKKPLEKLKETFKTEKRCAYISATGTGKSFVSGRLIEDEGYKTLVLVPSNEIRRGWNTLLPGVSVETYQGMHNAKLDGIDLLVCDEMHHLGAEQWGAKFKNLIEGYTGRILGLTATPVRFLDKGRNMVDELFNGIQITGVELPEAIEKGMLPSFDYITALFNLPDFIPAANYRNETTEKLYSKLDTMANECSFQNIMKKHLLPGNHKITVFVSKIDDILSLKEILTRSYPDASHYEAHSDMTETDRRTAIDTFRADDRTSFLYTVDLLNEGVHIPGVDTVVMFRRTESPIIYLQQIGRALSTDMKDSRIQIFDFVANHDNLKTCIGAGTTVIDWIRDGIGDSERQIIVSDYSMKEWELINRLRNSIFFLWDDPESRKKFYQDVRELYPTEGGIEKLQDMYPHLKRNYIQVTACNLGVAPKRRKLSEKSKLFILEHPEMSAKEVKEHLPGDALKQIRDYRYRHGIRDSRYEWTPEKDQILLDNITLSSTKIQKRFFPEISATTVHKRKKELGWKAPEKEIWPQDKIDRFSELYIRGGKRWVQDSEEFAGMSSYRIENMVEKYKLKRDGRPVNLNWSMEECLILEGELRKPEDKRLSYEEIAGKMPRHSPLAVKRRMKRMMEKMETWY